jgi:predicted enzyme related to lactoylglutathione lyase
MQVDQFVVNVNSEQPEKMIDFYGNVLGLTNNPDFGPGAFMAGSSSFVALVIEGHSELKGATTEPARVLLNFFVPDLAAEQQRLQAQGVEFTLTGAVEPGFGTISTFLDPDGNLCQLIQLEA